MRLRFLILLPAFIIVLGHSPASALSNCVTAADCVPRIDTVYTVRHTNLSAASYTSFYLVSYGSSDTMSVLTPQDGAAGLFVKATCNSAPDDGGSVLHDSMGLCFFRQNLNGDLRQWGLTRGSKYDVIANLGPPVNVTDASGQISAAFTALGSVGKSGPMTVHTSGISLKISQILQIPAGGALTCDTPPVKRADKANYVNLPGSLVIGFGAYIDAVTKHDAEVYDCAAIIPEWYIDPTKVSAFTGYSFDAANSANFNYPDLENIRANMILAHGWAIEAGEGAYIHDLMIGGFDNCLYVTSSPDFVGKNVSMDCSIGAYFANENGGMQIKDFNNNPYLTKQTGFDNEEYWTVTNVTRNSTTGECELTLNAVKGKDNHDGTLTRNIRLTIWL